MRMPIINDLKKLPLGGMQFPIFDGTAAAQALTGNDNATLFQYNPQLAVDPQWPGPLSFIPILGPIGIKVTGDLGINAHFGIGYDTYGIAHGNPGNGFYIDANNTGFSITPTVKFDV